MGKVAIKVYGFIEIFIGLTTVTSLFFMSIIGASEKTPAIAAFVAVTSTISILLGIALLYYKEAARVALIFFSGYIIITKILVFSGILFLKGEILTFVPTDFKNALSILYHASILWYFTRKKVKALFS